MDTLARNVIYASNIDLSDDNYRAVNFNEMGIGHAQNVSVKLSPLLFGLICELLLKAY